MRTHSCILACASVALLACLRAPANAGGEEFQPAPAKEVPKAEGKPAPVNAAEIKQAEALLKPIKNDEYAVLCGLRYLLNPSFEDELFAGRWRPVCPVDAFEQLGDGPLSLAEQLRLWAVLETGLQRNNAMDAQFARLAKTPPPEVKLELAPAGVYMLLLRSVLSRLTVAEAAKLVEAARNTLSAAKGASNACTAQSKWVTNEGVGQPWFANHFWRAVINRCALDLGLPVDFKLWGRDLDFLHRAFVEGKGWTCHRNQALDIAEDMHANLLAMATFGLASGAPPAQFSKGDLRTLEQNGKRFGAIISRLLAEYLDTPYVGTRALMLNTASAAPEGEKDPAGWRKAWIIQTQDQVGTGSAPALMTGLPNAMGLDSDPAGADVAEAAFGLVCLCGGLFRAGFGPLEKRDMAEIGRLLHALATLEAAKAPLAPPPGPTDLDKRVDIALENCRQHLLRMQENEGCWSPAVRGKRPGTGPDALALWALMHCGEPRDSKAVQRAMAYLEAREFGTNYSTYEIGLQLCMLEKYFEREIVASGMYLADTFEKREAARTKLREAMPKRYATFVDNSWKRLDEAWCGDGYGYGPGAKGYDNSNSQFAMLGIRAAVALGADVPVTVFSREAKRLFNTFGENSAWEPMPLERPWKPLAEAETDSRITFRPGGWSYYGTLKSDSAYAYVPHGCTGGGLCSLAVAIDELALRGVLKPEDELAADKCLAGALAALALSEVRLYGIANERIKLEDERAPKSKKEKEKEKEKKPEQASKDFDTIFVDSLVRRENLGGGRGMFYDLWALERGCVILGARTIAGFDWYKIVAQYLLSCQMQDGGWRPKNFTGQYGGLNNQFISTAWAALILKRVAPIPLAPSRRGPDAPPRPGKPPRAETGEPEPKPKEGPATGDKKEDK